MTILEKFEKGHYKVIKNEVLIGWLDKEHSSGSGRWAAGFVGYVKPYDEWVYSPESDDEPTKRFDTFKEAKAYVKAL